MRRPAAGILEQTDRADSLLTTEVKPMTSTARDANQIACLYLDRDHRAVLGMNVEQASAGDNISDHIFIVPVFDVELREHCI